MPPNHERCQDPHRACFLPLRAGDVDGALQQLTQATTDDPKDANSFFNLGMIRWQGKKDRHANTAN
jgi:hypothetical protein